MSVLALALKRLALSHGTVPKDCPDGTRAGRRDKRDAGDSWDTRDRRDEAVIEERAGLAADGVPACYLDAWARLNHQKPFAVSDDEWRLALDDGGRFLDAWSEDAAALGWTPGDLFDVTGGLVWRLAGEFVVALGPGRARLADERTLRWKRSGP